MMRPFVADEQPIRAGGVAIALDVDRQQRITSGGGRATGIEQQERHRVTAAARHHFGDGQRRRQPIDPVPRHVDRDLLLCAALAALVTHRNGERVASRRGIEDLLMHDALFVARDLAIGRDDHILRGFRASQDSTVTSERHPDRVPRPEAVVCLAGEAQRGVREREPDDDVRGVRRRGRRESCASEHREGQSARDHPHLPIERCDIERRDQTPARLIPPGDGRSRSARRGLFTARCIAWRRGPSTATAGHD
jgi:hypothetical protein